MNLSNHQFATFLLCVLFIAKLNAEDVALRVVGGIFADHAQYPFMVRIMPVGCGGTIIDARTILTAGHCVTPRNSAQTYADLVVYYGGDINSQNSKYVVVAQAIKHPAYVNTLDNGMNMINDIGILKLSTPIMLERGIAEPVRLGLDYDATQWNRQAIIVGWGATRVISICSDPHNCQNIEKVQSPTLQHVMVPVQDCGPNMNPNIHICAGEEGRGACYGDSGGPLLIDGVQYGIVSDGIVVPIQGQNVLDMCPGFTIFTRVAAFADFIRYHAGF